MLKYSSFSLLSKEVGFFIYNKPMLLTPFETAVIMSAIEEKLITTRQVYYRLEMYRLIGVKVGTAIRIPIGEVEVYYNDFGKRITRDRAKEITEYIKHKGSRIFSKSQLCSNTPTDFIQAIESVQNWRKSILEHKKRRADKIRMSA